MSFPKAQATLNLLSKNSLDSTISLKKTGVCSLFGTSIPMADFPGIGASILTPLAANPKAISSAKLTILLTFIPALGWSSNLVTDGPFVTWSIFASTPKLIRVSSSLAALANNAFLSSLSNSLLLFKFNKSAFGAT